MSRYPTNISRPINDDASPRGSSWMSKSSLVALALVVPSAGASAADVENDSIACRYDLQLMLSRDVKTFDQDDGLGWRGVAGRANCDEAAADLIHQYRTLRGYAISPADLDNPDRPWSWATLLYMHEAQLRANAGQNEAARALFRLAQHDSQTGWNLYIQATIAFLDGDLKRLRKLRAQYARLPVPPDYEYVDLQGVQHKGKPSIWPDNIDVVNGLVACFGRPYRLAYGAEECRRGGALTPGAPGRKSTH